MSACPNYQPPTLTHLSKDFADLDEACQVSRELACLPSGERQLRRRFGEQLITPVGTRGLVLRGPEETAGLPNEIVDVIEAQHIIRAEARAGACWYELSHDRLVEPILESNQAWEAARRWQETGETALLYDGAVLSEAEAWLEANPEEAEPYEVDFLEASREAVQARRKRR